MIFVQARWVQLGADRHRAALTGGVDEPIEPFGRIRRHGQQPHVGADQPGDRVVDGLIDTVAADQCREVSMSAFRFRVDGGGQTNGRPSKPSRDATEAG